MKKKLLIVAAVLVGLIVVLSVVLSLIVRSYLSSEKLKSLIIPKVEEATGRKAGIQEIKVSLFSGVRVEGISLKEQNGRDDFVRVKEFVIRYSLLPLLKKQLVIKDIRLIEPSVVITRDLKGNWNYQDIVRLINERSKVKKPAPSEKTEPSAGLPVSLVTDRIYVEKARLLFRDESGLLPDMDSLTNMNFSFSLDRQTRSPVVHGKLDLESVKVKYGKKTITAKGTLQVEPEKVIGDFTAELEGDRINKHFVVTDLFKKPHFKVEIYSKHLDLEKMLALVPQKKAEEEPAKKEGAKKRSPSEKVVRKPLNLTSEGTMKVDEAVFKGYKIKDFLLSYTYKNEIFRVKPLNLKITGGEVVQAKGDASGELSLKYSTAVADPVALAKKTAKGFLKVNLTEGVIKKSKLTDAIALFTGLDKMRNLTFQSASFNFSLAKELVNVKGKVLSDYMKADVKGLVDLMQNLDLSALLKVSPEASGSLTSNITKVGLFKDEQGWTEVPLKITGKANSPKVGLDPAYLKRGAKKQIEKELKKRGIDTSPVKKLFKGLF